ncbi:unnamed protein product [Schistosoma margrebowiei]|uniref:Uncharacterized protein n=1 Tax=Schistosoma margrebowiei TaxID=48269 RepID=A0AA84Z9D3_9TREM|nr:unnamed protein product [Schistosoma margrebowiei]
MQQSLDTNLEHEYITSNGLCHSAVPLNKIDTTTTTTTTSTTTKTTSIMNDCLFNNNNNNLSYRNLLTLNNSTELNTIQSSSINPYSQLQPMNKSMKVDYAIDSLMDLNYESVIHSNDNSKDPNFSLKYSNKYDKIPTSSLNSTIDPLHITKDSLYPPIDRRNDCEFNTTTTTNTLHHLWLDNESIQQEIHSSYPCCSTYYLGFYSTNDYLTSQFTDTLQYYNTKTNLIDYDYTTEIQQQNNNYFTNTSYLQYNNNQNKESIKYLNIDSYKVPEMIHEHDTISSGTSSQMNDHHQHQNDIFMTSNEYT